MTRTTSSPAGGILIPTQTVSPNNGSNALALVGGYLTTDSGPALALQDGSSTVLNQTGTMSGSSGTIGISVGLVGVTSTNSAKLVCTSGGGNNSNLKLIVVGIG